jgi:saccharopine dehydrogenase-like NADP-dependent oxidoreductase
MIPGEAAALIKRSAGNVGSGAISRVTPLQLDVSSEKERLAALVSSHDVVVSLVPAFCHPDIAKAAIAARRPMVTASYVAPEMKALHDAAVAAGVTILNEAGLDPGIDHISAKKMIDEAQAAGGTVIGFSSVCGGLPAPEAANNPLGYKVCWITYR